MRIIDADALLEKTQFRLPTDNPIAEIYAECVAIARENIEEAPTIDAVSVVHGWWELRHIGHGHYWECSVCHKNPCIYVTKDTKYCPNCGARMDGDE